MTISETDAKPIPADEMTLWKLKHWQWVFLLATLAMLIFVFHDGLGRMVLNWEAEEYSHGYLLPVIFLFLAWQRSSTLARVPFAGSWFGPAVVMLGLLLFIMGELGALLTLVQYGFLIALGGVLLSMMGWAAFRIILPSYALLFFAVPLPDFFYNNLSSQLQLISSQWGVAVIRLFGISVFLEGNVIDLGNYQLQVVEACSGLRYLFPLSALGYIAAVVFRGSAWKKILLFISTLPITVLMNSFRIGVIGILVNHGGVGMAEGFLHDFEGWVVFMACTAMLIAEMWLLARLGRQPIPLREAFSLEGPEPLPQSGRVLARRLSWGFYSVVLMVLVFMAASHLLPEREDVKPDRQSFVFFPMKIGEWQGKRKALEPIYVESLQFDDYLLADFVGPTGDHVELYVAYYDSQRKGVSVHSPKSCLPGGGWRILSLTQQEITSPRSATGRFPVNRSLIQMGDERLLVYYWFQQRGRIMTNEYLVKWYLLLDAMRINRTDGALVRLTVPAPRDRNLAEQDALLSDFARLIDSRLPRYIPE